MNELSQSLLFLLFKDCFGREFDIDKDAIVLTLSNGSQKATFSVGTISTILDAQAGSFESLVTTATQQEECLKVLVGIVSSFEDAVREGIVSAVGRYLDGAGCHECEDEGCVVKIPGFKIWRT